jgi:O-antigen/teichoic acid export membrane protein
MRTVIQASLAAINLYSEYFLGLFVSIIIARNLSTEDYGVYSSAIWVAALVTIAINAGLSITVTKFVAEFKSKSPEQLSSLLGFIQGVLIKRIVFVVLVFSLLIFLDIQIMSVPVWVIATLLFCAIFKATYVYKTSIFKGLQRFDVLAKTSMIANPINLISVACCAYFFPSVENFLLAYCLACIAFSLSILTFNKQIPGSVNGQNLIDEDKRRLLTQVYSASIIIFFGAIVFRQSQIIVLENYGFLSEAGYFNIAFILATSAVTLVPGIYQEVLLPKITQAVGKNNLKSSILQAQRYLLILCLLVLFPVLMYAEVIIDILYGERYKDAAFALRAMIILKVLVVVNNGANLTLISHDRQSSMAKINFSLFLFALVLSFTITPEYGVNGALTVYGILITLLLLLYNRIAKFNDYTFMPWRAFFTILLPAIVASIPALLVNYYLEGILSAIIGSAVFVILYLNLLFLSKGYDASVTYLLKQLHGKSPLFLKSYLAWGIRQLDH